MAVIKMNFFGVITGSGITGMAVVGNGTRSGIIDIDNGKVDYNELKYFIECHCSIKDVSLAELKKTVFNKEYKNGRIRNVFLVDQENNMYWGTKDCENLNKIDIKMLNFYINLGFEGK